MSTVSCVAAEHGKLLRCALPMAHGRFQKFVESLIREKFDNNKSAFARVLGVESGTMWRQVKDTDTLGLESLLIIAKEAEKTAREVLELAGKEDVADLLESHFGKTALTATDRELIKLPTDLKRALLAVAKAREHPSERKTG